MRKIHCFVSLSSLFVAVLFFYSFSGGITGVTKKSTSPGCTCHGSFTPGVNVSIIGPDTIRANDSANFSVTISGGPLVMGGTNIAARLGSLIPGDGLRKFDNELTHIAPYSPSGGTVTFNFKYKSPSIPGTDTIFANGNSVNFNGFSSGDNWNFAPSKKIIITSSTAVVNINAELKSFSLEQNYPNPFNPNTKINFSLQESSEVLLTVYNSIGEIAETLVNSKISAGAYTMEWDASVFPAGIYFYIMKTQKNSITKKMMLIK